MCGGTAANARGIAPISPIQRHLPMNVAQTNPDFYGFDYATTDETSRFARVSEHNEKLAYSVTLVKRLSDVQTIRCRFSLFQANTGPCWEAGARYPTILAPVPTMAWNPNAVAAPMMPATMALQAVINVLHGRRGFNHWSLAAERRCCFGRWRHSDACRQSSNGKNACYLPHGVFSLLRRWLLQRHREFWTRALPTAEYEW
jgi:hypothetical protein